MCHPHGLPTGGLRLNIPTGTGQIGYGAIRHS